MTKPLNKAMCSINCCPRENLSTDIVRVIVLRENRSRQITFWGYGVIATLSVIAIVPATIGLVHQIGQSGFYHYLSIGFSDPAAVTSYWKQFAVTLVEAIPVMSLTVVLLILLVLAWSARNSLRAVQKLSTI